MRKIIGGLALALALSGCAQFNTALDAAKTLTTGTVSSKSVVAAAETFDALETLATLYIQLPQCAAPAAPKVCQTPAIAAKVYAAVHAGRDARNQLVDFVKANPGRPADVSLFNVLAAAISALQPLLK